MVAHHPTQNPRIEALGAAITSIDRTAELPGVSAFERLALMRQLQNRVYTHILQLTKADNEAREAHYSARGVIKK